MQRLRETAVAVLVFWACSTLPASAAYFEFSYIFAANQTGTPGHVLTGVVEGELQADGDTIVVESFLSASLAGFPYTITDDIGIRNPDQTQPALMSLSGDTLEFWVCPQGFTGDYGEPYPGGDCVFGTDGGFLISYNFDFGSSTVGERAHAGIAELSVNGRYRDSDAPVNRAGWTARQLSVSRLEFTYMFEANVRGVPGHTLNGIAEGLLLADGDSFQILGFKEADLDGAPYEIAQQDIGIRAGDPRQPATMSLSGDRLDFWVCPQGFTNEFLGGGDCPFGAEGGFLVSDEVDLLGNGFGTAWAGIPAFGPGFRDGDSPIAKDNWFAEITKTFKPKKPKPEPGVGRGKGRGQENGRGRGVQR